MKCDKLKAMNAVDAYEEYENNILDESKHHYYNKQEVDEAIDELKEEIKRTQELDNEQTFKLCVEKENVWQLEEQLQEKKKEIEDLKNSHYAEMTDLGMENHKLKELLRKQKIKRAEAMAKYHKVCADIFRMKRNYRRYDEVELAESDYRKCRKHRKYSNLLFELADKLKEVNNV